MCFDEEGRRINTDLKTNQDISSKKLKDIPIESTTCEVFFGGEESPIETLRSLPREPVLMQMNPTEYEVNLLNDSEEVHFNDDIVMLNSSNNIEYHDLELLTFDVENILQDNMVHEGVNTADENIREQTMPSENDDKIELSNNDVEANQSEIDEQTQSVAKREENSHKNERKLSFKRRMIGQEYERYSEKGGKFEYGIRRKERRMLATCISNFCKKSSKRNCEKFSAQRRKRIFTKFWKLNWAEKNFMLLIW
ncbi:hypothetical protein HHI36_002134 [Cryptolaemus montrouzieri]|uniref:Uncharacterized protein n=1 Tax=Cryptolaemus montrouzieri TaxID=559131 RepID=A0ABD2PAF9_9CUCU